MVGSSEPIVAVLGAGSWGTALASNLVAAGHRVRLWARSEEIVAQIANGRNDRYLPGRDLAEGLTASTDVEAVLAGAEVIILATPSQSVAQLCRDLGPKSAPSSSWVLLAKGLERGTGRRLSEIATDELGPDHVVHVLLGPSHAEEVVVGQPTALVLAGGTESTRASLQIALSSPTLRVYTNDDLTGVEYAAALKNVLAIAAGLCDGLGLGDNAKGSLLARGVAEIARVGISRGAQRETFFGLSGVGDVITTCLSQHSRNRALGERVGQGESLEEAVAAIGQVVEGATTTMTVRDMAKSNGVHVPITDEVAAVLFDGKQPAEAMRDLMLRRLKAEWEEPAGQGAEPGDAG